MKTIVTLTAVSALFGMALMAETVLAQPDSGIYGRTAWRGELVPGIVVSAYSDEGGDYLKDPVGVSEPAATDGTYRLALPPGQYTLVARSGEDNGRRPGPGEFYCYYSGSPVIVSESTWTPVGFNLVRVREEERQPAERAAIEGVVTYRDEPLEKLYLYLYEEASGGFRGPGIATVPVGVGGRFRIGVRPGKYFLIARKRGRGGMYGPMEIGDYFNYYPRNPVDVGEGQKVLLNLETVTRVSQLEEAEKPAPTVTGSILDPEGSPVEGIRVFVYRAGEVTGRPLYFSDPSDLRGRYSLLIPLAGEFTFVARERFGGPAGEGQFSGRLDGVTVPMEADGRGVVITVRKGDPS